LLIEENYLRFSHAQISTVTCQLDDGPRQTGRRGCERLQDQQLHQGRGEGHAAGGHHERKK